MKSRLHTPAHAGLTHLRRASPKIVAFSSRGGPALKKSAVTMVALALAGCSAMSPQECRTADWREQGMRDAMQGQARSHFDDIREACAEAGVVPSQNLYFTGYANGLLQFCTPANGAQWGRQGKSYNNTCPPQLETAFLSRYGDGRRAWDAAQTLQRLRNQQQQKQRDLDQSKDDSQRRRLRDELNSLDWQLRNARDDLNRAEQRLQN